MRSLSIRTSRLTAAAILAVFLFLAGCSTPIPIGEINRDPGRFSGKEITIKGRSSDSFGGFGNGLFQMEDSTGSIWVLSQNFGLPGNGADVSITGQVQQGFSFGGKNYGIIFRQTKARQ